MLVLGVEHWRIEENLACLLCYSKLGLNESTRCYGKLSAAVFSDEFGAKFAGECQLKINLYSVYGLPVTVARMRKNCNEKNQHEPACETAASPGESAASPGNRLQ